MNTKQLSKTDWIRQYKDMVEEAVVPAEEAVLVVVEATVV